MEFNVNFILFEELEEKPDGNVAEARVVIVRESKDVNSALDSAADFGSPE